MADIFDNEEARATLGAGEEPSAVERRIFRDMCVTVAFAVALSATLAPWRVTTGLLLGGVLSLFSFHWLRASVASVFGATPAGKRPHLGAARYVLRYFVIFATVVVVHALDLISLVATLVGLCSFVVAALAEGFRQLHAAIAGREDT